MAELVPETQVITLPAGQDLISGLKDVFFGDACQDPKDPRFYIQEEKSANSYRSYLSALRDFVRWTSLGMPLPTTAQIIVQYLTDKANQKPTPAPSSLYHSVSAISWAHNLLFDDAYNPAQSSLVRKFLAGYKKRRVKAGFRRNQAPGFKWEQIVDMIEATPTDLRGLRDRAFIACGAVGAFRENELSSLSVEMLNLDEPGHIVVDMGGVKADQANEKENTKVLSQLGGIDPVSDLHAWQYESGIESGPIFLPINRYGEIQRIWKNKKESIEKVLDSVSHNTSNKIIRDAANRAGIVAPVRKREGNEVQTRYSVHSLRASFITFAKTLGIPDDVITRQTNHGDVRSLDAYDRPADIVNASPVSMMSIALSV